MKCRFEDRRAARALELSGARERFVAQRPQDLDGVFAAISRAQAVGRWVALVADYELGEWLLPAALRTPAGYADCACRTSIDQPRLTALTFEHVENTTPWTNGFEQLDEARDRPRYPIRQATTSLGTAAAQAGILSVTPAISQEDYLAKVEDIRAMIERGQLYQLNYAFPFDVRTQGEPEAIYRALAERHASAHAAYIEDESRTILSFSPELFLARTGARVITRPMKGTAPRHHDPIADVAAGRALSASVKDRSENLMIVDLLRNDLGQLARPGSVSVDALFTLEKYASVWTLTSTVSADVPNTGLRALLTAMFPCGSITGAPKLAAMQHIRRLESGPRGVYCGAIGWLAPDGDMSLNVAIRTLVLDSPNRGRYFAGGGIVYDSVPESEWQECLWKARVLTR
jgi:para-aminobenzoate synthetase component 1